MPPGVARGWFDALSEAVRFLLFTGWDYRPGFIDQNCLQPPRTYPETRNRSTRGLVKES